MALVVELRSEDGDVADRVTDGRGVLARLLPSADDARYPYLRYVDPYGDTTFNGLQMRAVLPELRALVAEAGAGVRDDQLVVRLLEMAQRCHDEVHSYLVVVGD